MVEIMDNEYCVRDAECEEFSRGKRVLRIEEGNYLSVPDDNQVIYQVTQSDGLVGSAQKNISEVKLAGYTVGNDNSGKIAATDTLGVALGKLQGQINGLDVSDTPEEGKIVTSVSETDGKIQSNKTFIKDIKVTGYQKEDNSGAISPNDTLNEALSKLENAYEGILDEIENNELVTSAALNDLNSNKQNNLVSGTNIKTINGYSILGSGNISSFIPIVNHGTSDTTLAINPNEFHVWDDIPELEITLIPPKDINIYNKYMFQFGSGNLATVLNDIPNVKWVIEPNIEPCMIYQAVIVNNIGIIYGVSNENYEKYTIPQFMELIHKGAMLRTGYVSSEPTGDNVTKYDNNGLYAYYRNLEGFTYDFNMLSTLDYGNYYPLYGFNELILDTAETDVNYKSKQICLYETDTSSELAKNIISTDYNRQIQTVISSNDNHYGCDILFTNIIGETYANGRMYKVIGEPMIEGYTGDEPDTFVNLIENLHLVAFIDKGFNITIGTDNLDGTYNFDLNSVLTENSLTISQITNYGESFSAGLFNYNCDIINSIYNICVILARSYNQFDIINENYSIFGIDMSNFIIPKRGDDFKYSFETNFAKFRLSFVKDDEGEYIDENVNSIYGEWQQLASRVTIAEYSTGKTYTLPNMNDIKFIIPTDFRKWMLRES